MCAPSPPPAPDYAGAAQAQGAANLEAARAQGRINNPNVINPYGTQTVTWDGDTPTLTQTLSPEQRRLYDQNVQTQALLGQLGQQGAQSLFGVVGKPVDFNGAPSMGAALSPSGGLTVNAPPSALDSRTLSALPTAYTGARNLPNMPQASEAIRSSVINAIMSRGDKDFADRESQQNSDLIARGLRPGTEAYERERDALNRARNDFRQQAELTAGDAAAQAFGMDLSRRQQGYTEQVGDATLGFNQALGLRNQGAAEQAQRFTQLLAGDAQRFNQQGQSEELRAAQQNQQFAQQDTLRRQAITEALARRQIPLNEITALLSGSQVANPFSMPGYAQNSNVAPAPIFAARQGDAAHNANIYNAQAGSNNAAMGAAGSLGAAALMFF